MDDWEKFYEHLFGGFEDLNDEDSYSEEEEIPENMKTLTGYSKEGGFVVDDDDFDDEDYEPSDDNSDNSIEESDTDLQEDVMGKDSDLDSDLDDDADEKSCGNKDNINLLEINDDEDEESLNSDIGSELSEESYVDSD